MPTTTKEASQRSRTLYALYSDGRTLESYGVSRVLYEYLDKPTTIRRPKPTDLFAGCTERLVRSYIWKSEAYASRKTYDPYSRISQWAWDAPSYEDFWNLYWSPTGIPPLNSLNNRVLLKIKDQKTNVVVSIAELGKTTDMVVKLTRELYATFHLIRSGRSLTNFVRMLNSPVDRASKKASNRWLEYVYGIVPTMHDIYGLSEEISRKLIQGQYIYVKATQPFDLTQDIVSGNTRATAVTKGHLRLHARYMVDTPGLKTMSSVGITNPAAVAYELMPWSFVLDWVINIGEYLNTLDALVGVKNLSYYNTLHYKTKLTFVHKQVNWTPISDGASSAVKRFSYRSGLKTDLSPRRPHYNPHLTTTRLVSAAALLRNLFK